ncbi:phosphoethanolamine transferase [Pandoraea nosoerga]|uniref:Membrane-associated, metal-dependent hydrolase n=1 Tax=Pandoraea nosoerga TaxID=2508296 RepID=A0A5E4TUD2_9BURK|nr:phosphoethanolamine transferase [Pandoraea nosoerga]VVD91556.1 membrane-associated, metal-dependent hydrolase [Pandoraea nosoerga]
MKSLSYRLSLGLAGLATFWALGMLSINEFGKSAALMMTALPGLAGLCLWLRAPRAWLSATALGVLAIFFLDAATKGFLRDYFGMRPNHLLVLQAVFNTNPSEAGEFLVHHWRDVFEASAAFAAIMASVAALERRLSRAEAARRPTPMRRGGKIAVATLLAGFLALHLNPTMAKENPLLYWPIRYLDYKAQLAHADKLQRELEANMTRRDAWQVRYRGPANHTVVWVIGESLNRNNMSLYGYARNTTPMLDSLREHLIVFRDVVSSEPATMASLMKMLTPASLDDPEAWTRQPDLVMLAREAGYRTYWISNQVPNDGWLGLVAGRADKRVFINKGFGRGENNVDGNLLPEFDAALADDAPRKLIVVHLLGAHPTYNMRYPEEYARFDSGDDAVMTSLKAQGRSLWVRRLRNEYDNAVAYNDFVVASLIRKTMAASAKAGGASGASLLFSSDHAQEVGHTRNHTGQSVADASGYEIPMIVWTRTGVDARTRAALEARPYQTDRLEHTMLGLLDIDTTYYSPAQDVLSDAFVPTVRRINGQAYAPSPSPSSLAPRTLFATSPARSAPSIPSQETERFR